jgi:hypothetical protein
MTLIFLGLTYPWVAFLTAVVLSLGNEEHAYLSGAPDVTIGFYESSYIVQALVLSVFVLSVFPLSRKSLHWTQTLA